MSKMGLFEHPADYVPEADGLSLGDGFNNASRTENTHHFRGGDDEGKLPEETIAFL